MGKKPENALGLGWVLLWLAAEAGLVAAAFMWDFASRDMESAAHLWAWITVGITLIVLLASGLPWGMDGFDALYWEGAPPLEKLRLSLMGPVTMGFPFAGVVVAVVILMIRGILVSARG